jgi:hypothetical protein
MGRFRRCRSALGRSALGPLAAALGPISPPGQTTMHTRARRCIQLRFGASLSEDVGLDRVRGAPAPCVSGSSHTLRGYESASTWITLSFMDQHPCLPLMPRPKFGRSHPTTAAAAPATSCTVHLQVVGREQMAIAADTGYGHGLENTFRRKAHDMSFGCSKARPRYHLQRFAPLCSGSHRQATSRD